MEVPCSCLFGAKTDYLIHLFPTYRKQVSTKENAAMIRCLVIALLGGILLTGPAVATDLMNRKVFIETGEAACQNVPLEIPLEGAEAPESFAVKNSETGALYPATLCDGKLVFVADALGANTKVLAEVIPVGKTDSTVPRVYIAKHSDEDVLDVQIDGVIFTRFHYGVQWRKPFLWPIKTEGGVGITRDFPMEVESTPKIARDHPHQKSLWSAYGDVNGTDFWAEGVDAGNQRVKDVTFGSGDACGWIRSLSHWENKDGAPLLEETREYRIYATPENGRLLDVRVVLKASQGEVLLKDTKEGGIVAVRMHPAICHAKAVITNAHGDKGEKTAWGKPSAWCDFSGEIPDAGWRGIAIFDHAANLRHPTCWHVRNYGLMAANPFGYSFFIEEDYNKGLIPENGDYTIAAGGELVFNYRVFVHSGTAEEAAVAARYREYAEPPKAGFVE